MIIANPIYDVVFKFLMEDERIAKFFIGTLLNEVVEDVVVKPQEYTYRDEDGAGFTIFRLDFVATVKTDGGSYKKVLVEIQKARDEIDLMRFRRYLAEQYKKQDEIEGKKVTLPIVTIYLLGFKLPEIKASVIKVNRQYIDLLSHEVLTQRSEFIEKLSHDCYVVQLRRIKGRVQTKLEKLLSVFEQAYFVDEYGIVKEYLLETEDADLKHILEKLHYAGTEPTERKKIEDEQEAYRVLEVFLAAKTRKMEAKIEEQQQALAAKDNTIAEKDSTIAEKDRALDESAKLIEELKRKLSGM